MGNAIVGCINSNCCGRSNLIMKKYGKVSINDRIDPELEQILRGAQSNSLAFPLWRVAGC